MTCSGAAPIVIAAATASTTATGPQPSTESPRTCRQPVCVHVSLLSKTAFAVLHTCALLVHVPQLQHTLPS